MKKKNAPNTTVNETTSRTQKYEGPDIASLLDRVRAEHGDDVRIVGANRCRSGGIAGFFAVESFEVLVEVPEVAGPERRRRGRRTSQPSVPAPRVASPSSSPSPSPSPSLEALIAAADAAEERGAVGRTSRSSVGANEFSSVLDRAVRTTATPPTATSSLASSPRPSSSASAAEPFDRWRTLGDENPDEESVESLHQRGRRRRGITKRRNRTSKRTRRGAASAERVIDLAALERAGLVPSLAPQPVPVEARRRTGFGRGDEMSVAFLASLGVPPRWMTNQADGHISLTNVLANLTPPPPMVTGPGVTIAVVGELHLVTDVARSVAVALRQDPDSCVLLTTGSRPEAFRGELVTVIDELADRQERWARRAAMTVVAIDIGFARHDVAWGRHAISSLRPAMRWGVVSATRKAEDVRAWAQGVGGLHALAVTAMAETTTPAAILSAGVPVARIDGQMATHELWTRLLTERLSEVSTRRAVDLIAT